MSRKSRVYANTINRPPIKRQQKKIIKPKRPIQKNVYIQVDRETRNITTQTDDLRREAVYEEIDEELPTNENPSELLTNENLTSVGDIKVNSKITSKAKCNKCKECCCIITTVFVSLILITLILCLYYNWRLQIAKEMNFAKGQTTEEIN